MQANNRNAPKSVRWRRAASRRKALKTASKPDRIPHQLFYPIFVAIWIGVLFIVGSIVLAWEKQYSVYILGSVTCLSVFIISFGLCALLIVPAAIFDRYFPTSTRL